MYLTWQRMKIVMEPSCAVPLATILKNPDVFVGQARRRYHHRRQCRSEETALDAELRPWEGRNERTRQYHRSRSRLRHSRRHRHGRIRNPDAVPDRRSRRLREQHQARWASSSNEMGVRHRSHGKMHKSVDVQKVQQELGGACGVCCQKVSEAEAFARGGIKDILVSNQVRDPAKIDRLARLPKAGCTHHRLRRRH